MELQLFAELPCGRLNRKTILACARYTAKQITRKASQIHLILISDHEMAKLHREFSGIRGITDVLTFDLSEPENRLEGEIYICLDQARRQAAEYKVTMTEEIARLAVHGILHLAGYDDRTQSGRLQMKQLEDRMLKHARKTA